MQINNVSQLMGIFKDVWGDSVFDPFRFATPIINQHPLEDPASEAGGKFWQPIMVTKEGGITHAPPSSSPGYGTATYVAPNAGKIPSWGVEAPQIYGRSLITYEAMMRSLKDFNSADVDAQRKAVKGATKTVVMSLGRSLALRGEILALNGGLPEGLGTIEAVGTTPQATTYEGVSGYYNDVSIDANTWARAIFAGLEGSTFDVYTSGAVKANTAANTALSGGGGPAQTGLILIAVNPSSPNTPVTATGRVLRFFHTSNGAGGVAAATLAATNSIFFETGGPGGSTVGSECYGLSFLASIGTGGAYPNTLYGIDTSQYSLARGNRTTSVGAVNFAKLLELSSVLSDFGVVGQTINAWVPTKLYIKLASNEAAYRRYSGEKKAVNGFESLEFITSGANKLSVMGHPFQKEGRLTLETPDEVHRVGPQDISFLKRNGTPYALESANAASSEVRAGGQYNFYSDTPKHLLTAEGITY